MDKAHHRLAAAEEAMATAPPNAKERLVAQVHEARGEARVEEATCKGGMRRGDMLQGNARGGSVRRGDNVRRGDVGSRKAVRSEGIFIEHDFVGSSCSAAAAADADADADAASYSSPAGPSSAPSSATTTTAAGATYFMTGPHKRARISNATVNKAPQIAHSSPTPAPESQPDTSALMALATMASLLPRMTENPNENINVRPPGPTVEQQGRAALALPPVLRNGAAKYVDVCVAVINSIPEEVYAAGNGILVGKQNNVNIMIKEMVKCLIRTRSMSQTRKVIHDAHQYLATLLQAPLTKAFDHKAQAEHRETLLGLSLEAARKLAPIDLAGLEVMEDMIKKLRTEDYERQLIEETMVLMGWKPVRS